jgi:rare lipoprotein A (peptidoglycan hydrolase)
MMTPELFDQSSRSDGTLAPGSVLTEPQLARPTATRPLIAQPKAPVLVSSTWNWDHELSWYGPGFYGHRTACGYALTTTLLGVAHRTLPCGTLITFKNPENGRTITVPVVDRGPYVAGRQWDLTGGLCVALDHCWTGPMWWRFA